MFFKIVFIQSSWNICTIWSDPDDLNHTLLALSESDLTLMSRFQERDFS